MRAERTGRIVERIRASIAADNWVLVEQDVTAAQSKDYDSAPEILAAHEQVHIFFFIFLKTYLCTYKSKVCLRKSIQETQQNLEEAARTFDANKLSVNIAAGHKYQMQHLDQYESKYFGFFF